MEGNPVKIVLPHFWQGLYFKMKEFVSLPPSPALFEWVGGGGGAINSF